MNALQQYAPRTRVFIVLAALAGLVLAGMAFIILYHPPLDWEEHFEIVEETWGIFDPSYRAWSGTIKNIGPYPILSADLVLEFKDGDENVTYSGKKPLIGPSDPPIRPGTTRRFNLVVKYTNSAKIDDEKTTYYVDVHTYRKKWYEIGE